ncbi:MAG: CRISPR system precrRNA processing endoribonuclease RAMP protein Cas6 [Gammaproteobacteria bacterium]|nr:CRISPR system precrRNA processing endoribonuclease RAMP protein Cas6 [Gammaproteobacteria bacterium]
MHPTPLTIPFNHYRFHFETEHPVRLPDFPGSAWRGAFGHALKKTVCVVRNTPCAQCLLKNACAYSVVFETPPPPGSEKMRKYNAAPHPFVLRFPRQDAIDTSYALDIILFGHAERYFPYIVHALQKAGIDGIGGHRQRFELHHIDYLDSMEGGQTLYREGELQPRPPASMPKIPDPPESITISLETPLRIKQDGKNLTPDHFNFGAFFANLLRRQSMLSYFHTDTPLETDFAGLTKQASATHCTDTKLQWNDWTRYSSRQQTEMNMGGLLGRFSLDMQGNNEAFWPYLWLGQWTHAGKATSMGLGAYTILPTSLPGEEKSTKWSSIK